MVVAPCLAEYNAFYVSRNFTDMSLVVLRRSRSQQQLCVLKHGLHSNAFLRSEVLMICKEWKFTLERATDISRADPVHH